MLERFSPATRSWFEATFGAPTAAQAGAWPAILAGQSTLLVAPTGSGKTLAAFLCALDRLLFSAEPPKLERCRVIYVSPLKALAFDVERNLERPLQGIVEHAGRLGIAHRGLEVAMRTGDTPQGERARFVRRPGDILITTPESLYLLLTSRAREALRSVETLIVDEVHAVAAQKRGSHLALSLERLEALRAPEKPKLQRIGLSATQKPLEEVARFLGGFDIEDTPEGETVRARPVTIVDAQAARPIELSIEVPVSDMGSLKSSEHAGALREKADDGTPKSIWMSIHPRLVELVRAHRSTMVFVNNRRLAERLSSAINELAGEPLSRAHHGSVAREQRVEIEAALKDGSLRCIVATSSLELGLDLGAVDLVVQIEAPPSVSSGIQRVGRANHHVGGNPRGTLFPKHRADLVACAEAARRMRDGDIETTAYPRSPLDVLAQQIVASVASVDGLSVRELFRMVRRAAPFAELSKATLESVLDMLSGRYPSDEFAELRPRLTWHRKDGVLEARKGAKQLALVNGGVIPDRGLYGVFLADGDEKKSRRVGELDEEMVFETRAGEVFVLGASSWRVQEITHDRVLVTPAPGEPGKMPFWHGDRMGRSFELGRGIGALLRAVESESDAAAVARLTGLHHLSENAAVNLVRYVREQGRAPYLLPTDRRIVVERFLDEVGDTRVCVHSPYGARVHAPLAICIAEKSKLLSGAPLESPIYTDDGIVLRLPESSELPALESLLPGPDEIEEILLNALGQTALFASHFRECAGRALLLPRRQPGKRSPLWAQRKRAADLLAVAARYGSFPILLETYRECLRDVFDVPALTSLMSDVKARTLRIEHVQVERPSPFSANLLFSYLGNFIYEGDAPVAERRAAALSIDHGQLRELLGSVELRELLDPAAIDDVARLVARLLHPPRHPDELHDLLLFLGDLADVELGLRLGDAREALLAPLLNSGRVLRVIIAGEPRAIAAEDAGRYHHALGVVLPAGLPAAFLERPLEPLLDVLSRYARCHGPFAASEVAQRYGLPLGAVTAALDDLLSRGRLVRGELHPAHAGDYYCESEVLRAIKRRSLAALRKEIEAVDKLSLVRFALRWHGIGRSSRGLDALRTALTRLEGAPLSLPALERDILPARVSGFQPTDLDQLLASGELVWRGLEKGVAGSGRIALYARDRFEVLAPRVTPASGPLVERVRAALSVRGAVFFHDLVKQVGAFPPDVLEALWELVWAGEVTNDTLQPLRSRAAGEPDRKRGVRVSRVLPGSEGRWTFLPAITESETARRAALVQSLLSRHGVLVREALKAEGIPGGFSSVYEVLRAMEEAGRVRRGYFVEGLGAAQFADSGADELLRSVREPDPEASAQVLAATDPASPWGTALGWPQREGARPMRAEGANVVLGPDGQLYAWLSRGERSLLTFFDEDAHTARQQAHVVAGELARIVERGQRRALLIAFVDGVEVEQSPLDAPLREAGFTPTSRGHFKRAPTRPSSRRDMPLDGDEDDVSVG